MDTIIHLGGKPVKIVFPSFQDEIELDELTSIDYGNLYGEAVTVSVLIAKFGTMRAEAEKSMAESKLHHEIYEARKRKEHRLAASNNAGKITLKSGSIKLTEGALDDLIMEDIQYQSNKMKVIEAKRQYEYMDAIFWAINSKDKKLNNIIKAVTPEELYNELVDGAINGMIINKGRVR